MKFTLCHYFDNLQMKSVYKTVGTCSSHIELEVDRQEVITDVNFVGGCNGNLQGISKLVIGQRIDDVILKLNGISCGGRASSCPDQLCRALEKIKSESNLL